MVDLHSTFQATPGLGFQWHPTALGHKPPVLTWDFQVQVTDASNSSHRWGPAGTGDALLDSPLPTDLHGKWAPCKNQEGPREQPRARGSKPKHQPERAEGTTCTRHMLVSEFGGDDVNPRHGGEVGDLAGAIFQVLRLDVDFAGAFHRQGYATVTCNTAAGGCFDSNSFERGSLVHAERTLDPGNSHCCFWRSKRKSVCSLMESPRNRGRLKAPRNPVGK